MNTTTYAPTRRRSISAYNAIINSRNERQSQNNVILDEEKRNTFKESQAVSQNEINALCNDIQSHYTSMVNDGRDMKQCQDELDEKLKEEELFYSTADEIYSYNDVNEAVLRKMNLRRYAYYTLPLLDCFFAYFALYPIVTSKIADLSAAAEDFVVIIGAVLSVFVGLGVSLISRLGVASIEENDGLVSLRGLKVLVIGGAVISLPLMYIIGEVSFNGGTQWTYSGCFAFISLIIQLLVVSGYKGQVEALEYFQSKKQSDIIKHIKETDENAIHEEIRSLREKMQNIMDSFNQKYVLFTKNFRSLVIERDEYIQKFGIEAKCYLDQMVIYFGNLICFHREVMPLHYEANGEMVKIPFVKFPHVAGGGDIFLNNDYIFLDYMMQRAHSDTSLSETLRIIKEQHQHSLNPQSPATKEQAAHEEPTDMPLTEEKFDGDLDKEENAPCGGIGYEHHDIRQEEMIEDPKSQQKTLKNVYNPKPSKSEEIEECIHPAVKETVQQEDKDILIIDNEPYVSMNEGNKSTSHSWLNTLRILARQMFVDE